MTKCPVCHREYKNAAGFSQHAKVHAQRGELVRVEKIKAETGKKTRGYVWNHPVVYARVK